MCHDKFIIILILWPNSCQVTPLLNMPSLQLLALLWSGEAAESRGTKPVIAVLQLYIV